MPNGFTSFTNVSGLDLLSKRIIICNATVASDFDAGNTLNVYINISTSSNTSDSYQIFPGSYDGSAEAISKYVAVGRSIDVTTMWRSNSTLIVIINSNNNSDLMIFTNSAPHALSGRTRDLPTWSCVNNMPGNMLTLTSDRTSYCTFSGIYI